MLGTFAGVGARGVRVANEVPRMNTVELNDVNSVALDFASRSASANGVSMRCIFTNQEARSLLVSHCRRDKQYDFVDIDPFGTPAFYIDCAVGAVVNGGFLSLTATDTPVLCGLYPRVALRRYGGLPLRTGYCHELGLRLLVSAVARACMQHDLGLRCLFVHNTRHYMRVYLQILKGSIDSDRTLEQIGYLNHCPDCLYREVSTEVTSRCECGTNKIQRAGPLWVGAIYNEMTLRSMLEEASGNSRKAVLTLLQRALGELNLPIGYYLPDQMADHLELPSPPPRRVIEELEKRGFKAARSALNPMGIKTNADPRTFSQMIKDYASEMKISGDRSDRRDKIHY